MTDSVTRADLRAHLVASRIAGDVATSRENNLDNYRRMSERQPLYLFGLDPAGTWTAADVLAMMAERCGVSPDPDHRRGQDTIDPDRTVDRLDAMADRLRQAADGRERVFVATGHPVGLRPTHSGVAAALRAAGCEVLSPDVDWRHPDDPGYDEPAGTIGYLDGIAVFREAGGYPKHTHSPLPMRAVLDALAAPVRPRRTWWSPTTAGPARPARRASTRSGSPTATTRPCSSARWRSGYSRACRSTTTWRRTCTRR